MSKTVEALAELVGGEVAGDGTLAVRAVSSAVSAEPDTLTFAEDDESLKAALDSAAGAVVVGRKAEAETLKSLIRADHPRLAFARIADHLHPEPRPEPGVHPAAFVHESAVVAADACVGPNCTVNEGATVGARTILFDGCSVGRDATVGEDCRIAPNVTLYPGTILGDRVRIHAGAVIGSDGFGYVDTQAGKTKFPQLGIVVLEDDVEIGANTAIDRAALDRTVIRAGAVIDNLVQIAHNVEIGRSTAISSQTGIAGTTKIGDRVIMGGQCGIADHAFIEDGVILGAGSGVATGKHVKGPAIYWGAPCRPIREEMKIRADVNRLGKLKALIKSLQRRIEALEGEAS